MAKATRKAAAPSAAADADGQVVSTPDEAVSEGGPLVGPSDETSADAQAAAAGGAQVASDEDTSAPVPQYASIVPLRDFAFPWSGVLISFHSGRRVDHVEAGLLEALRTADAPIQEL